MFIKYKKIIIISFFLALFTSCSFIATVPVYAGTSCGETVENAQGQVTQKPVITAIDLGCNGKVADPILDMVFGFIRFLSAGVGIVVVASVVIAGIQYTMARSNPQNVETAVNRIRTALIGLLIFIFAYAILDFLIPGGVNFFQ